MASYSYIPYVRKGLISRVDAMAAAGPRAEVSVQAVVQVAGGALVTTDAVRIPLFGPGDCTGLDAKRIIRTDPPALTSDWEPNYFPVIEFDRPDLPWMFTPHAANAKLQLQPGSASSRSRGGAA